MAGFPAYNFVAVPYLGPIYNVSVNLGTYAAVRNNTGSTVKQGHQSSIVQTSFDWLNTYKTQAVLLNLQSQSSTPPLDALLMLYVDNSGNSSDVTVIFPDTQMVVNVPAQGTGYFPVFTSGLICTIYNGRTGTLPQALNSTTTIHFCNFAIPGFTAVEGIGVAAPTLYRVSNSGSIPQYVTPVLGDKNVFATLTFTAISNPSVQVLPLAPAGSKYIITNFHIHLYNFYNDPSSPTSVICNMYITDTASFFRNYPFLTTTEILDSYRYKEIAQEVGIYGVATQLIFGSSSTAVSSGIAAINVSYAVIPV